MRYSEENNIEIKITRKQVIFWIILLILGIFYQWQLHNYPEKTITIKDVSPNSNPLLPPHYTITVMKGTIPGITGEIIVNSTPVPFWKGEVYKVKELRQSTSGEKLANNIWTMDIILTFAYVVLYIIRRNKYGKTNKDN